MNVSGLPTTLTNRDSHPANEGALKPLRNALKRGLVPGLAPPGHPAGGTSITHQEGCAY